MNLYIMNSLSKYLSFTACSSVATFFAGGGLVVVSSHSSVNSRVDSSSSPSSPSAGLSSLYSYDMSVYGSRNDITTWNIVYVCTGNYLYVTWHDHTIPFTRLTNGKCIVSTSLPTKYLYESSWNPPWLTVAQSNQSFWPTLTYVHAYVYAKTKVNNFTLHNMCIHKSTDIIYNNTVHTYIYVYLYVWVFYRYRFLTLVRITLLKHQMDDVTIV